mgnify:CR=1 FL=1
MQAVLIVLPIFLIIAMGWGLRQRNFFSSSTLKENNALLYCFAMPAILIRGILGAESEIPNAGVFTLAVCAPYLITVVIVWILARRGEPIERFAALSLASIRGNHFFAGLPIVGLAMGEAGVAAGSLILAFSLAFMQFLSIGSGQLALFGALSLESFKKTAVQLLKNPLFMSCVLALGLVFMDLNRLPPWLDMTLKMLADIGTGLALLMLGGKINLQDVRHAFFTTWKLLSFKLVVHPIVTYAVLTSFGLSTTLVQAGTLLAAMPEAVNTTIISQEMGMDSDYCALGTTASVLVSMITIPIWLHLLGAIR